MCYNCRKMGHIAKYCLDAPCKLQHNKRRPYQKPPPSNKKAKLSNISINSKKEQGNDITSGHKVSREGWQLIVKEYKYSTWPVVPINSQPWICSTSNVRYRHHAVVCKLEVISKAASYCIDHNASNCNISYWEDNGCHIGYPIRYANWWFYLYVILLYTISCESLNTE